MRCRSLVVLPILMAVAACQGPTAPADRIDAPAVGPNLLTTGLGAGFTVLTSQLRAYPPTPVIPASSAWGGVVLDVGFPPSPLAPSQSAAECAYPPTPFVPDMTPVHVCAHLHVGNPAGEMFLDGSILFTGIIGLPPPDVPIIIASLTGKNTFPPNPIRDCTVEGTVLIATSAALDLVANPTHYSVMWPGVGTMGVGGVLDGRAAGAAWLPLEFPPTPVLPPNPCRVHIGL